MTGRYVQIQRGASDKNCCVLEEMENTDMMNSEGPREGQGPRGAHPN